MSDDRTIGNLNRLLDIEREKLLEALESDLREAEEARDGFERQLETGTLGWSHPREWTVAVGGVDLPVPRIEMRWSTTSTDGYETVALYVLVHRHFLDDIVATPLGQTRRNSGRVDSFLMGGDLDLPFRDGAHFAHDARHLGLRAFITTDRGDVTELDPVTRAQTWLARGAS